MDRYQDVSWGESGGPLTCRRNAWEPTMSCIVACASISMQLILSVLCMHGVLDLMHSVLLQATNVVTKAVIGGQQ